MSSYGVRRFRVAGWAITVTMVAAFAMIIAMAASGGAAPRAAHRGVICGPPPTSPTPWRATADKRGSACADVRMTLTHQPVRIEIGRPFKATMLVQNFGPTTAFNVHAVDTPPASFTFNSVSGAPTCTTPAVGSNGTVDCAVPSLVNGASFTVVVTWRPTASGSQPNSAAAQTFGSTDPSPANNNKTDPIDVQTNSRGCTMIGTVNADVINGTAGADVICGLAGADQINGGGGDDTLFGQRGGDTLTDHNGTDRLFGGPGDDSMDSADGAAGDIVNGNFGTNTCSADAGDTTQNCS